MFSVIFSEIVFQSRDIHQIISFLNNSTIIKEFATYLTGEDVHSNITTRQSWSKSGLDAGKYIQSQFDTWGFKTTLFNYKPLRSFHKFNPNVIAEWVC